MKLNNKSKILALLLSLIFWCVNFVPAFILPALAVVPTTNSTSIATGDGSTPTFTFTFELLQASDMTVYVNSVLQTAFSAYVVNPTGGLYPCTGGTITFQTGHIPAISSAILMARQLTLTQTVNLPVEGALSSATIETVFDRTCMQVQQLNTATNLCLQLPITSIGVSTALPTPVANNLFGWASNGTSVVNYTPAQIVANVPNIGLGNVVGSSTTIGNIPVYVNALGTSIGAGIAPGTANNVLTSTGSAWISSTPTSGAPSNLVGTANPNGANAGTVGQLFYDKTNAVNYVCVTTGSSSTAVWTRLTEPVGTIKWWWSTAVPPTGYHVCDGTNGTPNMIGMYPQGSNLTGSSTAGNTNGFDTGGSVTNQSVVGAVSQTCTVGAGFFSLGAPNSTIDSGTVGGNAAASSTHTHSISGTATSSSFSIQPAAIAAPWIMRIN